jgi:hypothetical protein
VADIVLLKDSFEALPLAFAEGQRVRNGMHNVIKLFLTRVDYLALLLLAIPIAGGFSFRAETESHSYLHYGKHHLGGASSLGAPRSLLGVEAFSHLHPFRPAPGLPHHCCHALGTSVLQPGSARQQGLHPDWRGCASLGLASALAMAHPLP